MQWASELQRQPFGVEELVTSDKCSESDTTIGHVFDRLAEGGATLIFGETSEITGGEDMVAAQCATREVAEELMRTFQSYQDFIITKGVSTLGSQPTKSNIRGGLTTIEEKAMGNIQKMGTSRIQSVLKPAEEA